MGENVNGFIMKICGAGGCDVAGFWLEGNQSGGWASDCWADQCTGDGWVIKSNATHYSADLQLNNVWAQSCARGLVVIGYSNTFHVDTLQISNGIFNNNKRCGIRLEGYISNSKFNVIAGNNNSDNVLTDEATNLLIYQGCQQITFSSSMFSNLQGASRKETVRLVMDTSAGRWQITNFYNCILSDDDVTKAKIGIKNTHATYELNVFIGGNRSVDNSLQDQYVLDPASTGTVHVYNLGNYLSFGSSFPSAPFIGQYFYRDDLNVLYRYTGTAWNPVHNTTGEGTAFPASKQTGDIFFRTDEGKLYKWNGSLWVEYLLLNSTGGNLVCNSDFEVPTLTQQVNPYGWSPQVHTGTPTFNRVSSDQISGAYCVTILNDSVNDYGSWYSDYFPILPSRPFLLSGYCKTTLLAGKAEVIIIWHDKNKALISMDVLETASTAWTRLSKVYTAPANAAYGRIELRGYIYAGTSVTYSYDNVKFVELSVSGTTFPTNPVVGDIFYHETYAQSFGYDPDSPSPKVSGWVNLTRVCHSGTTAERAAASVVLGDFWFDTDQQSMYRWTGVEWYFMGTSLATVQGTEPSENLLRNADFEIDLNADTVPDNWMKYEAAGTGSIAVYTTDQMKGKQSCKVNANASSTVAALSDAVPFDPNKGVYIEVYSKPSVNNINVKIEVFIYGYAQDKTTMIGEKHVSNGSRSPSAWTKDSFSTTPATDVAFGANRANIRYLRLALYCHGGSYGSASYVLFDCVRLSLQAAATGYEDYTTILSTGLSSEINVATGSLTQVQTGNCSTETTAIGDTLITVVMERGSSGGGPSHVITSLHIDGAYKDTFMAYILTSGDVFRQRINYPENLSGKTVSISARCIDAATYIRASIDVYQYKTHVHTG